jgi:dephospho-CoA kinase
VLPKKVAITGGIASGKSTVCHLFEELGATAVSADQIVHELLIPTTSFGKELIALLGADTVVDGVFNRERIAQKVFRDPLLLEELEKRIHPRVQRVIDTTYKAVAHTPISLFVAEVPLLYEAGLETFYDKVILVLSDEKNCRKRFRYGEEEYRRRSQRLMPIEEKITKADLIINNNGSLRELRQTIQTTYNALKENI